MHTRNPPFSVAVYGGQSVLLSMIEGFHICSGVPKQIRDLVDLIYHLDPGGGVLSTIGWIDYRSARRSSFLGGIVVEISNVRYIE